MVSPPVLADLRMPPGWLSRSWRGLSACAHDIPNQRVDRSIQVTLSPGRLEIDYEVSLTELTLTQDLRSLVGPRPGAERSEWLALYGEVTGPLNAKGFLVSVDGAPVALASAGYRLVVEEHPRYTFHLEAQIPAAGRLAIRDTNFVSSEGTSRLAIRGRDGVVIEGDRRAGRRRAGADPPGLGPERRRRATDQADRGPISLDDRAAAGVHGWRASACGREAGPSGRRRIAAPRFRAPARRIEPGSCRGCWIEGRGSRGSCWP